MTRTAWDDIGVCLCGFPVSAHFTVLGSFIPCGELRERAAQTGFPHPYESSTNLDGFEQIAEPVGVWIASDRDHARRLQ